jgi:hypothetical protein
VAPRAHGDLERGGESLVGASGPRARWRIAQWGRQALERGSESPEGYHGRSVGGLLWFLWAVGLFALGCNYVEHVF